MKVNFNVTGDVSYLITVKAGVLLYQKDASAEGADVTVTVPKQAMVLLLSEDWETSELIKVEGDTEAFKNLMAQMVEFDPYFNIIEP